MDEAQRGREKEEGGSVGDRDPDGDKGQGASLGVAGDSDCWGPDNRMAGAPPVTFSRRGVLFPPPVDWRRPVGGEGSNGEDKK